MCVTQRKGEKVWVYVCVVLSVCRIGLYPHRKCFYINLLVWLMPSPIYYWHKCVLECVCVCVSSRALPSQRHCLPYVWVYVRLDKCVSSRFMSCSILRTAEKDKILQNCIRDTVITNLESYNKLLKTGQIGHFIYNTYWMCPPAFIVESSLHAALQRV